MKAVLFDLDGVLVNTERINTDSAVLSMREQGIKLSASDKKLITGRNPIDYSIDFLKKYKFDRKRMIARFNYHYVRLYCAARPFKHARELVLFVKRQKLRTALVTASDRETIAQALKVVKIPKNSFDEYISFEVCKKRKPDPLPYVLAAKKLGVKPSECVVIEDSVAGVASAKRAGIFCVAVTNSYPASALKKADLVVKSLNDKRIRELLC